MSAKMRRRLKQRRSKGTEASSPQHDSDDKVFSPPRLRRGGNTNTSTTNDIAFKLEPSPPITETGGYGYGSGTISTLTNDKAFSMKRFDCGFDNDEFFLMKKHQSKLLRNEQKPYLQIQKDGRSSGVGCTDFGVHNKLSTKESFESPVSVDEIDSFNRFQWAEDSKAKIRSGGKLNLRRNSKKKDDDTQTASTFFYSQSEATTESKLLGEVITLESSASCSRSFDKMIHERKQTNHTDEQSNYRRHIDTYQLGMGREESPVSQQPRHTPKRKNFQQTEKVRPTEEPSSLPRKHRQSGKNPQEEGVSSTDPSKSGCNVPAIVEEIVEEVKSMLSDVIATAYTACNDESEESLSKRQEPNHQTHLDNIEEEFVCSSPVQGSSGTDNATGSKPWAGYCCHPVEIKETVVKANLEAEYNEKNEIPQRNRLKKMFTSFKRK